MTKRYPGGYITKTAPTVSTTSAPGIWTMEQQAAYQKAGTWPFGGPFNYIEDVFSTYLYTGNGSTQTITNGIDLSTYDGLVWCKNRAQVSSHELSITRSDLPLILRSNATDASQQGDISGFHSAGFFLQNVVGNINQNNQPCVSWTFREQPKFFDIVTYTGNGVAGRTIAHSLGSTPGMMIVKNLSIASNWRVYHQSLGATKYMYLNTTSAAFTGTSAWNDTAPTSTVFTVGNDSDVNNSGDQFVAYLFAHNAGGFGLTGTDNVISCGSFTTDASANMSVTLGYEPQWLLIKRTDSSTGGNWYLVDNMRGFPVTSLGYSRLFANTSAAEVNGADLVKPSATGFYCDTGAFYASASYIYIAIRRGPMKTPTSGTSVFDTALYTGNATARTVTLSSTMPYTDMGIWRARSGGTNQFNQGWWTVDRLRGMASTPSSAGVVSLGLLTAYTDAEGGGAPYSVINNTADLTASTSLNVNTAPFLVYSFRRAPGFFDEVCYTGTGATNARTHNLTVAPELIICKSRSAVEDWFVLTSFGASTFSVGYLNTTLALTTGRSYASTADLTTQPTATTFSLGSGGPNTSGATYVAYLFASCPGVSKVGSYTGTGTTKQIDCGFTGGARFVLIKRTDSTGDWYVWDSARGIVAGNDPYLLLNSTAAEVTNTDYVDTYAAGFEISSTAPAAINANGGTFIFLAIA